MKRARDGATRHRRHLGWHLYRQQSRRSRERRLHAHHKLPAGGDTSAEAIIKRPVVVDDAIAIRSMMNLEVSFDHRILDGGVALHFLNAVKRRLESYTPESGIG